jgi:hypothetical protein
MTVEEVERRVEEIRAAAGDDEVAHSLEDKLHRDVLAYFAEHERWDVRDIAQEALKTRELGFARWTA